MRTHIVVTAVYVGTKGDAVTYRRIIPVADIIDAYEAWTAGNTMGGNTILNMGLVSGDRCGLTVIETVDEIAALIHI